MSVCGHFQTRPAAEHPEYVRCIDCGTYMSTTAPAPETIYTADYWTHERGHSTMEEQVYNCEEHLEGGVSKNQFILDRIAVEDRSAALEIGCAPGALLKRLKGLGFTWVFANEMNREWQSTVESVAGFEPVWDWGKFPGSSWKTKTLALSLIVAADVFEHSPEPWPFLLECSRLLKKDGQILLMLPIAIPGEEVPCRMFHPQQHIYIHSQSNLTALLAQAGFDRIEYSRWCPGHEVVSARKGTMPESGLREPRV